MLSTLLLKTLLTFASTTSGYPIPAHQLPVVRFVDACALGKASLNEPSAVPCGDKEEKASQNIFALFDYWGSGAILMPLDCAEMRTLICKGALAHESTHWLQAKAGAIKQAVKDGCPERMEREAYAVEAAYYKAHGSSLAAQGISPLLLAQLTTCKAPW